MPATLARKAAIFFLAVFALTSPLHAQRSESEVDLLLVLAVDVSFSMDPDEQELQRQGYVEAFRAPLVHKAISRGVLGRIAVTYMEWSGVSDQEVIVPWTVIYGAEDAMAFADQLSSKPLRRGRSTSISAAIDVGAQLIHESGFMSDRRVIDISGDGANNQGRSVTQARDEAVASGITINGLPIMIDSESVDDPELDLYYRDCVVGGPGAFVIPVREREQIVKAIKTKIVMETSYRMSPRHLASQAGGASARCRDNEDRD